MNVVEHQLLTGFVPTANPGENGAIWAVFYLARMRCQPPFQEYVRNSVRGKFGVKIR